MGHCPLLTDNVSLPVVGLFRKETIHEQKSLSSRTVKEAAASASWMDLLEWNVDTEDGKGFACFAVNDFFY